MEVRVSQKKAESNQNENLENQPHIHPPPKTRNKPKPPQSNKTNEEAKETQRNAQIPLGILPWPREDCADLDVPVEKQNLFHNCSIPE